MEQEHERAAGAWHAEWEPLSDLLRTVGSAAAWLADCLSGLDVDTDRMRTNLLRSGAALAAEAVAGVLTEALGRTAAHDLVGRAVRGPGDLRAALLKHPSVRQALTEAELDELLDPAAHVGHARVLVDRALAQRDTGGAA
jgi:3-carboxy-cis,cis-muconate cycloisomerase